MSDSSRRVYDSVLDLLSDVDNPTPLVRLSRLIPFEHTEVYAKLEHHVGKFLAVDLLTKSMSREETERHRLSFGVRAPSA